MRNSGFLRMGAILLALGLALANIAAAKGDGPPPPANPPGPVPTLRFASRPATATVTEEPTIPPPSMPPGFAFPAPAPMPGLNVRPAPSPIAASSAAPESPPPSEHKDSPIGQPTRPGVVAPRNFPLMPTEPGDDGKSSADKRDEEPVPPPLRRPLRTPEGENVPRPVVRKDDPEPEPWPPVITDRDPPLGFTGPSGIIPRETQGRSSYVPIEDRWRLGFPDWDRYGQREKQTKPELDKDYQYELGKWFDPFNQHVLKGDYPILGDHTFLDIEAKSFTLTEGRLLPTPTTPRDSTANAGQFEFFGKPGSFVFQQNASLKVDLFHGDAGFKPVDWRLVLNPIYNINNVAFQELGIVSPDVLAGTHRTRSFFSLEQYFVEHKIADLSPYYDVMSIRIGSQPFVSDFRGFMFYDINRAVRIFGNRFANRDQFNLVYFSQAEKDTNSGLNTFNNRNQNIVIANYYRQDFIFPGYTAQASFHYNNDQPTVKFDKNRFLVRPDPVGIAQPHELNIFYLGFAGDGHIGRYNITHQFYWALGRDDLNPLANRPQNVNAQFFALEVSYDRDWARFRSSFLFSSGDGNTNNSQASGFDSIQDYPIFAGGGNSFFQRQAIGLFGVNLTQRNSFIPDLRSSKIQGQSNFVNPGLLLGNFGFDADLTPKLRIVNNVNMLWFHKLDPLKQFLFANNVNHFVGFDISSGIEWRPLLSNNILLKAGVATLIPGVGFRTLYDDLQNPVNPLAQGFVELTLQF